MDNFDKYADYTKTILFIIAFANLIVPLLVRKLSENTKELASAILQLASVITINVFFICIINDLKEMIADLPLIMCTLLLFVLMWTIDSIYNLFSLFNKTFKNPEMK